MRFWSKISAVLTAAVMAFSAAAPTFADYVFDGEYWVWQDEVPDEEVEVVEEAPIADVVDDVDDVEDACEADDVDDDWDWDGYSYWSSDWREKSKYSEFTLVKAGTNMLTLCVGNNKNAVEFKLYLYDKKKGKYVIKEHIDTKAEDHKYFFGDTWIYSLNPGTTYKLMLVSYDKNGEKIKTEYLSARTLSKEPHVVVKNNGKQAVITWEPCQPGASGYEVYRKATPDDYYYLSEPEMGTAEELEADGYKLVARKSSSPKGKITVKNRKDYLYVVRTFKVVGGKRVYSGFSCPASTEFAEAYVNTLKLKSHERCSGEELKLVKKYVAQVTDKKMSNAEKLRAIFMLVHSNGNYQNDITKISASRPVWQLMVKGEGQCATWAYTLYDMLEYAGFDIRVVRGLRPSGQQHFWCQIKLNGSWYNLDAHLGTYLSKYDGDYREYVIQDYSG